MPEAHVRVVERDAVRVAWRVPAIAEAARLARWLVRRKVAEWGGDAEAGYTAGLLASELVTNAVVHAGGDALTLVVARADGGLRVEVHDRGRGEPALRRRTAPLSRGGPAGRGCPVHSLGTRADAHREGRVVRAGGVRAVTPREHPRSGARSESQWAADVLRAPPPRPVT